MADSNFVKFIFQTSTLIQNSMAISKISDRLLEYGYTNDRLRQGLDLVQHTETLTWRTDKAYGQSRQATRTLDEARTAAHRAYIKTLKIARIAFDADGRADTALKLSGPRKQSVDGWLDQASTFYANLAADQTLGDGLRLYGYTAAKLNAEAVLVERVRQTLQIQAREAGEARKATSDRDQKLAELRAWVKKFRTVVKVAFSEDPQELEKLGIVVLNAPRRKKKTEPTA